MARVEELKARGVLPSAWAPVAARHYAGFWRRAGAALVDGLFFLPVSLFFGFALSGVVPALIAQSLWLAYVVPMDARGATLGKRALGIKVVDAGDRVPGTERSARRHVWDFVGLPLAFVDIENDPSGTARALYLVLGLAAIIDVLWMLGDDDRQTLHDKFAGTYVVRA
jgi:uncharacterized RDD family membrane protein YckC